MLYKFSSSIYFILFILFIYLDDLALVTSSVASTKKALEICDAYGAAWQITFNPDKTECLQIGKLVIEPGSPSGPLTLANRHIKMVDRLKYLGTWIDRNLRASLHLEKKREGMLRTLYGLRPTGLFELSMATSIKKQLYQTYCRSTLLYGMETTVMNKSELEKLKKAETIAVKDVLGLSRRSRNTPLWAALRLIPTHDVITRTHMNFIERLAKNEYTRQILKVIVVQLSWANGSESKWERKSVVNELWETSAAISYVARQGEGTFEEFLSKCDWMRRAHQAEGYARSETNPELLDLLRTAHLGDARKQRNTRKRIEDILIYTNQSA